MYNNNENRIKNGSEQQYTINITKKKRVCTKNGIRTQKNGTKKLYIVYNESMAKTDESITSRTIMAIRLLYPQQPTYKIMLIITPKE